MLYILAFSNVKFKIALLSVTFTEYFSSSISKMISPSLISSPFSPYIEAVMLTDSSVFPETLLIVKFKLAYDVNALIHAI